MEECVVIVIKDMRVCSSSQAIPADLSNFFARQFSPLLIF